MSAQTPVQGQARQPHEPMEHGETMLWANYVERYAACRGVIQSPADGWYFDGHNAAGEPVEVKACRVRISTADRRGRWWIEREAHDRLLRESGHYFLVVYDPSGGSPIAASRQITAEFMEEISSDLTWLSTGGHAKGEEARLITWSRAFDPQEVEP